MSDSPWNTKPRNRRAPQGLSPESARVRHVPRTPPDGGRPHARMLSKPIRQAAQAPHEPRQVKRAKGAKPAGNPLMVAVLALCLLLAALSAVILFGQQGRLANLEAERAARAQRLLDHKAEHLNARDRSGYLDLIERYAAEYGISPSFVSAIIKCESSFRAEAVSRVDARGLMQIMPGTGQDIAGALKMVNYTPDSLFDAETNIRFGTYYLARLSNIFNGNPVMVAAAYHAGDTHVKQWALREAEDRKTIRLDQIPTPDTRDYVGKVMDAYAIYYEKDQGGSPADTGAVPGASHGLGAGK